MEMELNDVFTENVVLEDEKGGQFIQQVVYEWRPLKCKECSRFGHTVKDCKQKQGRQIW